MRILLFKIGAIGDTLMTTPLVRQLRKNYPKAKIDYLIGNIASQVLEENPNINKIVKFDENIFFKKKILQWRDLIKKIKQNNYDVVFVLDKHWIFNLTAKLFGIKERIGFDRMGKEGIFLTKKVHYESEKHEIFYYLDLLYLFCKNVNYSDTKIDIFIEKNDEKFAQKYFHNNFKTGKVICIALGGGVNVGQISISKRWSEEKYSELVTSLLSNNYEVLLIGGSLDRQLVERIRKKSKAKAIISKNISKAAALLKMAYAVVCNDGGLMHISASVNERVISIFGPTDPKRFAPLGKKCKYLWKPGKCCPSNDIYGKFHQCKENCIEKIKVKDVIDVIKKY
ncbi:MAG: lipopolysaccharide heptosyltransferase II [Candidatus Woesearchaeota archaeon]